MVKYHLLRVSMYLHVMFGRKQEGFVRFPLAWCSDDATWAKFADYTAGIISLPGTPVYWRNAENKNISNSMRFDGEKLKATGLFLKWIGMNYRLNLRESRFQDALVTYVNVILECSVRGNYTLKDCFFICYFEKTFSYYGFTCSTFPYFESQTFYLR